MEYTLVTLETMGDVVSLYTVAESRAYFRACAGNRGFHKPAFVGALPEYVNALREAAEGGLLQVCNQFGDPGTPVEILKKAKSKGKIVSSQNDESLTLVLNVYVKLHHLNIWAREQGDLYRVKWAGWVDERGYVDPSGTCQPIETPQADEHGGAKSSAVAPGRDSGAERAGLSTKEIAQTFDGINGWSAERWPKNLGSAKWLRSVRTAQGAPGGATAMWDPLMLVQLIYGREKSNKRKEELLRTIRSRAQKMPILQPWKDAIDEYCETYSAAD